MKEGCMDTAWNVDAEDVDQETTPRPWSGSHAKPRASLRLIFADGYQHGLSYSDYKGYRLRDNVLKIYFTSATVIEILRETPSFRAGRKGGGPCGATAEPSGGVEAPAFRPGRTSTCVGRYLDELG